MALVAQRNMRIDRKPVRLAMVGCGAMTELGHLPALQATTAVTATVLIDTDEGRAKTLAQKFRVPHYSTDLEEATKHADAACVVVPHHVHTSVACDLIGRGLGVLIEKPLASTVAECDTIIRVAQANNVVLAVAMVRRFARTTRVLKEILLQGTFGKARSFRLVSGVSGVWPTKSAYLLNAEHAGGGVLISNGVHDLDLLSYLFGLPKDFQFFADTDFGKSRRMENDALITMITKSDVPGVVELSRTRDLRNGLYIELERADIHSPLYGDEITVDLKGDAPIRVSGSLPGSRRNRTAQSFNDMLTLQLEDFAAAVRGEKAPMVDGPDGRKTVGIIEQCYSNVRALELPWRQPVFVPERS
jgi:predicted dehydrogenase